MKCKVCGTNSESEFCFRHKPRKSLSKGEGLNKSASTVKPTVGADKPNANEMHKFFKALWSKKPHISHVSGKSLGKHASSAFFHHVLPKSKYPELAYVEENIVFLTLDEHANVESDMYRYPLVNSIREKLLKKYNLV